MWAPFVEPKRERPRPRRTFRSNLRESLRPVRMVATEASDFCKRSARVRPMSFVAYPRARVRVLDAKPERSESERLSARA